MMYRDEDAFVRGQKFKLFAALCLVLLWLLNTAGLFR